MDCLALLEHLGLFDFATSDVQKKVVIQIFHGCLDVFEHQAVKVSHAFAHSRVFGIGGCEIGFLEE